jgi:hypothetical protein
VGAETATTIGAPQTAAFWIISTETRLVSRMAPESAGTWPRARAPTSLASALCRPTSSRRATIPLSGVQNAAALDCPGFPVQRLQGREGGDSVGDGIGRHAKAGCHLGRGPHRLGQALDAA